MIMTCGPSIGTLALVIYGYCVRKNMWAFIFISCYPTLDIGIKPGRITSRVLIQVPKIGIFIAVIMYL